MTKRIDWDTVSDETFDTEVAALTGDFQQSLTKEEARERAGRIKEYRHRVRQEADKFLKGPNARENLDALFQGILCGDHSINIGTSGTGKTYGAELLARITGLPMKLYVGQPDTSDAEFVGVQDWVGGQFRWNPGFLATRTIIAVVDELPRVPASTLNNLLLPMTHRKLSVPDLGGQGRRLIQLPLGWVLIATGNPVGYGGNSSRNEAVMDRFAIGVRQLQPAAEDRLAMLRTRKQIDSVHPERLAMPFTLADVRASLRQVEIDDAFNRMIVNISYLTSPPSFRRLAGFDTCFLTESQTRSSAVRKLEKITEDNLMEGGNPRGEELMQRVACGRALMEGRLTVQFDDVAFAARSALRYRLKPNPGCDEAVPEVLNLALNFLFGTRG